MCVRHAGTLAVGVDVAETVAKQDGLGLPDGGTEGYELTVEVGLAHRVAVHKGQMAHSCPTELFGSIAAHSTQSDNEDMGRGKTVEVGLSEEQHSAGGEWCAHFCITSSISTSSIIIHGFRPLARCHEGMWGSGRAIICTKRTPSRLTEMVTTCSWVVFMDWSAGS